MKTQAHPQAQQGTENRAPQLSAFDEIRALSIEEPAPGYGPFDDLDAGPDHRRSPRVTYRDPVQARLIGASREPFSWALLGHDLSETGLMLTSPELFPVRSRLLLWIDVAEVSAPIQVVGQVMWVAREDLQERYRLGIRFDEPSALARAQLRELVLKRDQPTADQGAAPLTSDSEAAERGGR